MRIPEDSETFCTLPFLRVAVESDGSVRPCCTFENHRYTDGQMPSIRSVEPGTLSRIFHSPQWDSIRAQMLNNELVKGCDRCYQEESRGMKSFRQESNEEFGMLYSNLPKPEFRSLETYISNLCNLKCRTCSSQYSSQWTEDDGALSRKSSPRRDLPFEISESEISSLTQLNLLGGEPFAQMPVLRLLSSVAQSPVVKRLQIIVHTNGTIFPSAEVLEAFRRCHNATITISVDGYEKEFEYLRKNAKWSKLEEICNQWLEVTKQAPNCKIELHPTVSAYNALTLPRLVDWWEGFCLQRNSPVHFTFGYCYGPEYLNPSLLPSLVKAIISSKWRNWLSVRMPSAVDGEFERLLKALMAPAKAELEDFFQYTDELDQLRDENVREVFPELMELLKGISKIAVSNQSRSHLRPPGTKPDSADLPAETLAPACLPDISGKDPHLNPNLSAF